MLHDVLFLFLLHPFKEPKKVSQGRFFFDFGFIPAERIDKPPLSIQRPLQAIEPTVSTTRTLW